MQIRIAGFGGQGVILAGVVLGEAAAIEGLNVIQTQDYSAQSRGGASVADVIISTDPIFDVVVTEADILVALSQQAYEENSAILKNGGVLIIDTDMVRTGERFTGSAFTTKAEELGLRASYNMIVVGYLVGSTEVVNIKSAEKAVLRRVPKGTEEKNLRALMAGFELSKMG
ncbi:2-oxoacid:acceptor oxidoreductase family protein [Archaeoglobus neptunius]|uniref:2-oxoacid:acceptor oxidoreductase family protein n=1 Tax=Archaeoglobus neptunius TaxID=2798580 RepID=UPI0019265E31|nr:2-oxoacid:acceptor oxidoreductase family protein [Archaeoglobus neptunius]